MSINFKQLTFPILLASSLNFVSFPAMAIDEGDWLIRGRIINIAPDTNSGNITAEGETLVDTNVTVEDSYTLDIDITYMLGANTGIELLLDLSSEHDISSNGSLIRRLAPGNIMSTRLLPPSLIFQYHFVPNGIVRPYAGFGISYAYFFDEKATDSLDHGLNGVSSVSLDSALGWVTQFGVDYEIGNDWFLNADVKYMDLGTTASIHSNKLGDASIDVDINPWIIGIGIGKRF